MNVYRDQGAKVSHSPSRRQLNVALTPDVDQAVRKHCRLTGIGLAPFVTRALLVALREQAAPDIIALLDDPVDG